MCRAQGASCQPGARRAPDCMASSLLSRPALCSCLQAPKGKKVAAAPSAVKKAAAPAKPVNPLYEKRPKTFSACRRRLLLCCQRLQLLRESSSKSSSSRRRNSRRRNSRRRNSRKRRLQARQTAPAAAVPSHAAAPPARVRHLEQPLPPLLPLQPPLNPARTAACPALLCRHRR